MAKDLVCGMTVDEETPVATTVYQDKTYYFCSVQCKQQFDKNPQNYTRENSEEPHQQDTFEEAILWADLQNIQQTLNNYLQLI